MGREWQIGDPVDGTTDGWMDAQNWGHGSDDEEDEREDTPINPIYSKRDTYSKKAWQYYNEFKDEKALDYINQALAIDKFNSNNWNKKAIILEALKRYEESEDCYNESLRLSPRSLVYDNKARMLYKWAKHLCVKSKELPNGLNMLDRAKQNCIRAINTLPSENSEENIDKYLMLRESIDFQINYEKTFQRNFETLKTYPKDELFTIAGTDYYRDTKIPFTQDMPLKLIKEPDNEFDKDAIAVYTQNKKIGYVANNDYTTYELTSKASELQNKIADTAQGSYLFNLGRYDSRHFTIGRIIK